MKNLIQEIYNLKTRKELIETQITKLKKTLADIDEQIDEEEKVLLQRLTEENLEEIEYDNLVGFKQSRKNIGYTSEVDVLNILKSAYDGKYVKTKITESIDKNALKKALKDDAELKVNLEPFMLDGVTEYIVVTTKENRERMLEHINDSKK